MQLHSVKGLYLLNRMLYCYNYCSILKITLPHWPIPRNTNHMEENAGPPCPIQKPGKCLSTLMVWRYGDNTMDNMPELLHYIFPTCLKTVILCTYSPVSFKINIVTSKLKSGHQLCSIVWFKTPIPGWQNLKRREGHIYNKHSLQVQYAKDNIRVRWSERALQFTFQEFNERQKDICFAKQHGTAFVCSGRSQKNNNF